MKDVVTFWTFDFLITQYCWWWWWWWLWC